MAGSTSPVTGGGQAIPRTTKDRGAGWVSQAFLIGEILALALFKGLWLCPINTVPSASSVTANNLFPTHPHLLVPPPGDWVRTGWGVGEPGLASGAAFLAGFPSARGP